MNQPKSCVLWGDPEAVVSRPLGDGFERLETFVEESHWWRYLLKCRECGQLYFFEFLEEVDWVNGDDPQFSTWIPIETDEEVERLKAAAQLNMRMFRPHLCVDRPKGEKRKVYWVTARGNRAHRFSFSTPLMRATVPFGAKRKRVAIPPAGYEQAPCEPHISKPLRAGCDPTRT